MLTENRLSDLFIDYIQLDVNRVLFTRGLSESLRVLTHVYIAYGRVSFRLSYLAAT